MTGSKMTSTGHVTLPASIRRHLRVVPGDRIRFAIREGRVMVVAAASSRLQELEGMLHGPGRRPVSLEGMDDAISRGTSTWR